MLATGEQGIIGDDGSVQVHRVDYQNPTVNQWGNKSYPVKVVTVGKIHKLSEVEKLGLDKVKGRKSPAVEPARPCRP